MEEIESKFPERLKELRTQKGISQRELAQIVGVSQVLLFKWEKNLCQPDLKKLMTLSKYFDVTVDYLIGFDDDV